MKRPVTTIMHVSLMLISVALFPLTSSAIIVDYPESEYGSIYKYNALENKNLFVYAKNETTASIEKTLPPAQETNLDIEKLKDITKKQADSIKQSEDSMRIVGNKSGMKRFLVGDNLGTLKFQMVQMKDQRYNLNILLSKTDSADIKTQINSQIETLIREEKKVENFILQTESKFSLFGWLIASI